MSAPWLTPPPPGFDPESIMYACLLTRSTLPLLPLIAACGGDKPVGPGDSVPASGTIQVVITTRGPDPDPDGYTLRVGTDVEIRVGSQIVFASDRDPGMARTVFVMGSDGAAPVRLTATTSDIENLEMEPSWSPNGGRITYVAGLTGLWTAVPDGSSNSELGPPIKFDLGPSHPAWSGP